MTSGDNRYGFVVPRFGRGIAGGAETLVAELARALAARGDHIEVFTTCARDNRTWENSFPAGSTTEDGVVVHRFPVDARDLDAWVPLQIRISEGMRLSLDEQLTWMAESVNSQELYSTIARRAPEFRAVCYAPYLFGTTFWGSLLYPKNAVLIPCLHDEYYAYLEVIESMFRQVRGCLFNAAPEMELARSLYGSLKGGVVGMGFEGGRSPSSSAEKPFFDDNLPYVLYLGRKETGKNVHLLVDYFCAAKAQGLPENVKLVICGGGDFADIGRPEALSRGDVVDLVHVTEEEKVRLLRHALCLCQPSRNESFSIVLMEAWRVRTPVVVHGLCSVTAHHASRAGGGLLFVNEDDMWGTLDMLLRDRDLAMRLGASGSRYVEQEFSWGAVLARFDSVMDEIFEERIQASC